MATDIKKGKEFISLANPNSNGNSLPINVNNIVGKNKNLNVSNGSSYSRRTSYLYENYYLIKEYENGTVDTKQNNQKNAGIGLGKLKTIKLNGKKS